MLQPGASPRRTRAAKRHGRESGADVVPVAPDIRARRGGASNPPHPPAARLEVGYSRLEARHETAEITVEARHILDERGVSDAVVDDPARCTAAGVDEFLHDLG